FSERLSVTVAMPSEKSQRKCAGWNVRGSMQKERRWGNREDGEDYARPPFRTTPSLLPRSEHFSAGEHEAGAVDLCLLRVAQPRDRAGNLLGREHPARRILAREAGAEFVLRAPRRGGELLDGARHEVGVHVARADGVDGDALPGELGRQRPREANEPVLRRAV